MELITCPVCKEQFRKNTFKNHFVGSAKLEAFNSLNNMLNAARGKPYRFSPRVLLSNDRHLAYYRKTILKKLLK